MPAVFQIVSRSSGNALARSVPEGDYAQTGTPYIMQAAQDEQDPTQMWVLTPQDSSQDFLIQPFGSPGLAMGVLNPLSETEYCQTIGLFFRPLRKDRYGGSAVASRILPTSSYSRPTTIS